VKHIQDINLINYAADRKVLFTYAFNLNFPAAYRDLCFENGLPLYTLDAKSSEKRYFLLNDCKIVIFYTKKCRNSIYGPEFAAFMGKE